MRTITRVMDWQARDQNRPPEEFEPGVTTYVLCLDDLYLRFARGEYHPLSFYVDFRSLVWTLLQYQDSVEVWHLVDHMLDPPLTAAFYEAMDVQLASFMNILLESYVQPLPTRRNETVVPVFVTETAAYVKSVPYDS